MKADDVATLTINQWKPKKCVRVLLSLYRFDSIRQKKKPKTIELYNKTKCGADVKDQVARQYPVKEGSPQ